jgi:hypothetical protein
MSNSPEFAAERAASGRREAAFNALVRRHINYIAVVAAIARGEPTYGEPADDEGYELREEALAELVAADTAWREAFENYQEAELFGSFRPGTLERGPLRRKRRAASCKPSGMVGLDGRRQPGPR